MVAPAGAPPFPFASVLPGLSPSGAQWEIAAGMRILDRAGEGIRSMSPYVPASSLLGASSGASASASGAAPGAASATSPGGGGRAGVVIVIVIVLALAGVGAFWLRRRSRGAG